MFFYEKNVMHVLLFKPPLKPPATFDFAIASGWRCGSWLQDIHSEEDHAETLEYA